MALKYPNKHKRAGYWRVYERARINDFRVIFEELCSIIPRFTHPVSHGPKPVLELWQLYVLCVYCISLDIDLRNLEAECDLLFGRTIDHSNLSRWFSRLDEKIIDDACEELHKKMIYRRKIEYIVDSTAFTLTFYEQLMIRGLIMLKLVTWKLHVIVAYLPALGLLSVAGAYATYGDAHDSPVYRDHLLPSAEMRPDGRIHGDSAYWCVENIRQTKNNGLTPNFVPRDGADGGLVLGKALKEYDEEARKRYRGMVEGFFGGIATRQGTKCRFRNHQSKVVFCHAMALAQQVRTYLRFKVLTLLRLLAPTPSETSRRP